MSNEKPEDEDLQSEVAPVYPRRRWWGGKSRKPYIVAALILPNYRIIRKMVWLDKGWKFNFKKQTYAISRKAIYTEKFKGHLRPTSYWFFDNPEPIVFDTATVPPSLTTAATTKELLESKVISDLVTQKMSSMELLLIILVGINLAVTVGVTLKVFNVIK